MYKLILSPQRFSALLYASHILDNRTVVMVLSDGYDETTKYGNFCMEALAIQRKFELEKAYKVFKVRQLYHLNQYYKKMDYDRILVQLQLLLATSPFTHFYFYVDGDDTLNKICRTVKKVDKKIMYSMNNLIDGVVAEEHRLTDEEYNRKAAAATKMITIRDYLMNYGGFKTEFISKLGGN